MDKNWSEHIRAINKVIFSYSGLPKVKISQSFFGWGTFWPTMYGSQDFRIIYIKYLNCSNKYNAVHYVGQIGNHQCAVDWHYELWSWMSVNCASSRSLKLRQIFKNANRYDDVVNWSRIGNHPWAIDGHQDIWPRILTGLVSKCQSHTVRKQ